MIENTMLDPTTLKPCMSGLKRDGYVNRQKIEKQIKNIDKKSSDILNKKNRIIDLYANGNLDREEYQKRITAYDNEARPLNAKRNELTERVPVVHKPETIDRAINKYCNDAKEQFKLLDNFESKRRFIFDFIEKVTFRNDRITVHGSVPIETSKIEFIIKRKIDRVQLLEVVLKNDRSIDLCGTKIKRAEFGHMVNEQASVLTPNKLLTKINI